MGVGGEDGEKQRELRVLGGRINKMWESVDYEDEREGMLV